MSGFLGLGVLGFWCFRVFQGVSSTGFGVHFFTTFSLTCSLKDPYEVDVCTFFSKSSLGTSSFQGLGFRIRYLPTYQTKGGGCEN